jgi:orotidine-5'-phosphate decarboxylase
MPPPGLRRRSRRSNTIRRGPRSVGLSSRDRLFVALDVDTLEAAEALLDRLAGVVAGCKIGSQLYTAAGPAAVERAHKRGLTVFLDLKFHDIPNTVAAAVREATRLGVFMLDVHASGGSAMMQAAAAAATAAAREFNLARPRCLAVTVLTSLDRAHLQRDLGVARSVDHQVLHLAEATAAAGLDGCVTSPREIATLRANLPRPFVIVAAGVRPPTSEAHDQARTATPGAAMRAGADYLVVGRPITAAADPAAAAAAILEEIARA